MFGKKGDHYSKFVEEVTSGLGGNAQNDMKKVLESDEARTFYQGLKEARVSDRIAENYMKRGVRHLVEKGHININNYMEDMAEEMRGVSAFGQAIDFMGHRRYLSKRQEEELKKIAKLALEEHVEGVQRGLGALLKKAAVILLLIGGVYYIFKSIPSITGGVIGSSASGNIIFGSVLFLFALAISHFYIKE